MQEQQLTQSSELVQDFERLQREFEAANPNLAEAMKVMNMSLADYLSALSYMREGQQVGTASDHSVPLAGFAA